MKLEGSNAPFSALTSDSHSHVWYFLHNQYFICLECSIGCFFKHNTKWQPILDLNSTPLYDYILILQKTSRLCELHSHMISVSATANNEWSEHSKLPEFQDYRKYRKTTTLLV